MPKLTKVCPSPQGSHSDGFLIQHFAVQTDLPEGVPPGPEGIFQDGILCHSRDKGICLSVSKIDAHIYSFYPQATALWNRLPTELRSSDDLETFS